MRRDWIEIAGEHINLATASSIEEIGPQGTKGYKIYHGDKCTELWVASKSDERIATRIRLYIYDRTLHASP